MTVRRAKLHPQFAKKKDLTRPWFGVRHEVRSEMFHMWAQAKINSRLGKYHGILPTAKLKLNSSRRAENAPHLQKCVNSPQCNINVSRIRIEAYISHVLSDMRL